MTTLLKNSFSRIKTLSCIFALILVLTGCTSQEVPMTDAEMAEKYGLSMEDFKAQKSAAARMNMNIEDHLSGSVE
ncbi:hypothetical protein COB57_02850 [Candidatus Peregrinibacteria bacterium]|nr:MAG: hypothetical protein COB57_02850 [Candidatus Peregrinibacteria bacterium]